MTNLFKMLKILDDDGTISLSHISVALTLGGFAALQSRFSLIAFFISLINFNLKKFFALKKAGKAENDQKIIDGIYEKINRLEVEQTKLIAASTFNKMTR